MNIALAVLSIICLLIPFLFAIITEIKEKKTLKTA